MICVCESVKDNCWNLYDSYGEICVHCGCCSKDKKTRYQARLQVCKKHIAALETFDRWSDNEVLRKAQERNIKSGKKYWKRMLRYYQKKCEEVEE